MTSEKDPHTAVKAGDTAAVMQTPPATERESSGQDTAGAGSSGSGFVERLYQNYHGELVGWLRRRFGDGPPEPHDIAQTAFAKMAALENHEYIENPKAFLYATAINTANSSVQRIVRARRFFEAELKEVGHQVEQITPERVLEDRRQLEVVNRVIAELPEKQREILIRSRIQGQTYHEIVEGTGWSKAAISRHLNAALATLQKALDNLADE